MKNDPLLIYAAAADGKPTRAGKQSYLRRICCFLVFCQQKGLLRRPLIKGDKKLAPISTIVCRSDLTDEGYCFFKAVFSRWSSAIDRDEVAPGDTTLLEKVLARIRGVPFTPSSSHSNSGRRLSNENKTEKMPIRRHRRVQKANGKVESIPSSFRLSRKELTDYKASGPHIYDKADWHLEGEFPRLLMDYQAYVRTGMFVGWLAEMSFIADEFLVGTNNVKPGSMTGAQFYKKWGGVLASDMLKSEGNRFTLDYYENGYFQDYDELLTRELPSHYYVEDSTENYSIIKDRIRVRYRAWKTNKCNSTRA